MTSRATDVRRQAWATRLLFAANGALFASWVSRIPAVRDHLHASPGGLGFALLFSAIGSLIAMPMSGRLVVRFGARAVITFCVGVSVLAYPGLGVAPNLVVLGAILLAVGAAVGVWDVAMNVSGSEVVQSAGRDLMPGFHAAWSIGSVVGAGIGALCARLGIVPAGQLVVVTLALAALSVAAVRVMPDVAGADGATETSAITEGIVPDDARHVPVPLGPLVLDPRLLGLGAMVFCAAWAEGAANDWLALMLHDTRDASGASAAIGFAIFAAAMTTARFFGTSVLERFGRLRTLRIGACLTSVGVVLLLTVPVLGVGYLGALCWGLGIAVAFPLAMTAAGETPGRGPSAIATVATIAYAGFLVGPPLIGSIADALGLDRALWVVLLLMVGILAFAHHARPVRAIGT